MIQVIETAPEDLADQIIERAKEIKKERPKERMSACFLIAKGEFKHKYGVGSVVRAMSLHGRAKLTEAPS